MIARDLYGELAKPAALGVKPMPEEEKARRIRDMTEMDPRQFVFKFNAVRATMRQPSNSREVVSWIALSVSKDA